MINCHFVFSPSLTTFGLPALLLDLARQNNLFTSSSPRVFAQAEVYGVGSPIDRLIRRTNALTSIAPGEPQISELILGGVVKMW